MTTKVNKISQHAHHSLRNQKAGV